MKPIGKITDKDRELFLKTLGKACGKTDWQIYAWGPMRSHIHPEEGATPVGLTLFSRCS